MWIKKTGQIKEGIYIIGSFSNPIYLINCGDEWVLIEGGVATDTEVILKQLKQYVPDLKQIKHWFIVHSHYDHCGTIECLYPHFDHVSLYASKESITNFRNPKYIGKIRELNYATNTNNKDFGVEKANLLEIPFMSVHDNEKIKIGNQTFEIKYTPGHSICSLSIYNPENKILFVSDALGEIITEKEWFPLAFQNIGKFITSIDRLNDIDVDIIALGHYGVLTDTDAEFACVYSLQSFGRLIDVISELIRDKGMAETFKEIKTKYYNPDNDFVPEYIYDKSIEIFINQLKEESFV